jgi:hypothetical protein
MNFSGGFGIEGAGGQGSVQAYDPEENRGSLRKRVLDDDIQSHDIDSDSNIPIKGLDPEFMPNMDSKSCFVESHIFAIHLFCRTFIIYAGFEHQTD